MRGFLQISCGAGLVLASLQLAAETPGVSSKTVFFPAPVISLTPGGQTRVSLPDCTTDGQSAQPLLPVACVSFQLPAHAVVDAVSLSAGPAREIPLAAPVEWGLPPRSPEDPPLPIVSPDPNIYQVDAPYPDYNSPVWRADPTGDGTLLSVQLHPVRVSPVRRVLLSAESLTVCVTFHTKALPDRQPAARAAALSSGLAPGPHTYAIISTSNLIHEAPAPWNFQALCSARAHDGFTPALVTTEWIYQNYEGTNNAARIRAFVQDAYQQWGLRYLLLGGTFDLVPVQKLHIQFQELFFTRTADIPADAIYYGCMDGTFDGNNNGRYGELTDGTGGGDVDLTAEVMVGRFPVANATELAHMVRKTLRYRAASPADLAPQALIAEKMDMGTLVYATGFMEEIRNGSAAYGLNALGFKSSPYADRLNADVTLYDSDAHLWTASNALAFLNQNLHTVNHIGHGSTKLCVKISTSVAAHLSALRAFTNDMPFFIYSQACSSGGFDTPDCFAEQIVTVSNAAFAAVMNAREGWEFSNVIGGYSHRYHRAFWDAALRGTGTRLGEINELSRRANMYLLSAYSANYWRWVYYELNLFGDPAAPFAAAINVVPPVLSHEPLINTYDTQNLHRVTCSVEPVGVFDPSAVTLIWRSSREPGLSHTQTMSQVFGNLFEGFIGAQPADTRIDYLLSARNYAGAEGVWPESGEASFFVTDRLELDIRGSPANYGSVAPDYGVHAFASGLVADVSAPALHSVSEDTRFANHGFFGTGSAPQSGTNLNVSFRMDTHSLLVWMWQCERRLLLRSDLEGQADQALWGAQNAPLPVPSAPARVALSNGTAWAFAEWRLDGARTPPAPGHSAPAFGSLLMDAPHTLEARYLPADLDADANGLADWWECQYFGTNGQDPQSDTDTDGYTLSEEYLDRASPLDAGIVPAPPVITHAPLAETQTRPGPFTVRATITDTHQVSLAAVRWHRKTEPWQDTPMTMISNDVFEASIGSVSEPGDDFEYQIVATDPSGRTSQTAVYYLFLCYPVADTSRFHDLSFVALPTQSIVSTYMNLHNTGNADLVWSMRFARVESVIDPDLPTWNRTSLGQLWQASTNRSASAPYALHSLLVSSGTTTGPAVRSTVSLPPLLIGPNASLSFKYWIHSEPYQATTRAFDGGIVEYSKDNGATFQQLRGPYTHTIYGWAYSPWTNGTPCLAGNGTEGWRTATFDFVKEYPDESGFQGRSLIFRFHYGGDNNTDNEGWYVDDVAVMPLVWQQGFSHSVESTYSYTIPAGGNKRILWCNLPPSMDVRDDNLTVFLLSNDPVNPASHFFWQLKIRDYPMITGLQAAQSAAGDGRVILSSDIADADGEPVTLNSEWSPDNGKHWQPAALTNVFVSVGAAPTNGPSDTIADLLTATNGVRVTNQFSARWESRAIAPPLTVNTQMLFRLTATNGFYGAVRTSARFTVDNVPPVFNAGAITVSPLSLVGPYALTANLLSLTWPAAVDTPAENAITYRLSDVPAGSQLIHTNMFATAAATLALSNSLDVTHLWEIVALDPYGNASAPLSESVLVLDSFGDYDGDGLDNASEEIAGTLATDPSARFTVALQSSASNQLSLAWQSAAGRLYTVEATPNLQPPAWQPLPGLTDLPGTGGPITVDLPKGPASSFFRIRVRIP